MAEQKRYDMEFKKQAVRLAKEIGGKKAAKELNVSPDTLYGWMRKERNGSIDLGPGTRTPENALGLAEEVQQLRAENKKLEYEEKIDDNVRIIVYRDEGENNSKRKSYKQMIDLGESNYTQEKYEEFRDWWGVYFIQTTTTGSASEVYADYKARWSIETFNNYIKNDADFNNLKIQDYYAEYGFDFIMLVAGLIHSRLGEAVKAIGKSNISTFDLLVKAGHMRMVLGDNEWKLHNTRTKDLELIAKTGFTPQGSYPVATIKT